MATEKFTVLTNGDLVSIPMVPHRVLNAKIKVEVIIIKGPHFTKIFMHEHELFPICSTCIFFSNELDGCVHIHICISYHSK